MMKMHLLLICSLLCALVAVPVNAADLPAEEIVMLAIDDHSIPLTHNLQLTPVVAEKHPANPVLRTGPEGSPDYGHAILYGTVIRDGEKFRMWYLAMFQRELKSGNAPGYWRPMCYAESDDGIHWTKPNLGLVELNGNKDNNICLVEGEPHSLTLVNDFLTVLYEPNAPDPARRYKVAYIAHPPTTDIRGGMSKVGVPERLTGAFVCATSADGLRWKLVDNRPANAGTERYEVSGLYKFGNFYYAPGQLISPWCWLNDGREVGRAMLSYRSPDLVHWSKAKALAFVRPGQITNPTQPGQQTHMGAGIWNRGNVLVGLYGMWQDGPKERPQGSSHLHGTRIDLGLIVSNDGIHFREPVTNHKVIPRGEEGKDWDSIALLQGHAFAQVGDQTYIWYSHWDCEAKFRSQEIGLATLRRDGFGYLSQHQPGTPPTCITTTAPAGRQVLLNMDGVSPEHPIKVELLDAFDRPLADYAGDNAAHVTASGVQQVVSWPKHADGRGPADQEFAVRLSFPDSPEVKLYAIYARP